MFVLLSSAVLVSLLSFSGAAPAADDCSQLIQPVHELQQILGRWILIEGFSSNFLYESILRNTESMWFELSTTADNGTLLSEQAVRLVPTQHVREEDRCLGVVINATIVNHKDVEIHIPVAATYHRFLKTCTDCLLMYTYNKENDFDALYLFGRNTTLPASDLETTKRQAECYQFLNDASFHYNTSLELPQCERKPLDKSFQRH